jgi:trimethylamine--corrinoid protein Co-methyltransferase
MACIVSFRPRTCCNSWTGAPVAERSPDNERGGRRRRRQAAEPSRELTPQPVSRIQPYEVASDESIEEIHEASLRILEEAGIAFYDDRAVARLREHGVDVDDEQLARFDRELVMEYLAKAPETFVWRGRNPERNLTIGGNHIAFGPVVGPPYVDDLERGRRTSTRKDLIDFIKLTMMSPTLHFQGAEIVVPGDVPFHERALDIMYDHFIYGDKPIMGHYGLGITAYDSVEMCKIAFGADVVAAEHVLLGIINISSPRRLDDRMLGTIEEYAGAGKALCITPFILVGAMGPATILGTVTQANAEALAGIIYIQMVRPGTPVVYGPFLASVDLQSGSPVMGSAESALTNLLSSQLARRYKLPFRPAGAYSSAKVPDVQTGIEVAMSMVPSMLAQPNFVLHAAGWMENGLTTSLEKFVLDTELLGVMLRLSQGVSWDEDEWAMDEIMNEVPPGGHHLGTAHTFDRFRTAFYRADLFDYDAFETWEANGATTASQRGHVKAKALLDAYERPPIDDSIVAELADYVSWRRGEIDPVAFQ